MGQQVIVTNPTKGNIDVGGTTLTPGSSGTFDIGQVPDKYRKFAVIDMNAPRDQSPIIRSLRYSQIPATQNSDQDIIYRIIDRKGQPLCRVIDGKARWLIEGEMDDLTGVIGNIIASGQVILTGGKAKVILPSGASTLRDALPKTITAALRARGGRHALICIDSDSTTNGLSSATPPAYSEGRALNLAQLMSREMALSGIKINTTHWMGQEALQSLSGAVGKTDSRVTVGAGWTESNQPWVLCGGYWETTNTNKTSFYCDDQVDSAVLIYMVAAGTTTGTITLDVGGSALYSASCDGQGYTYKSSGVISLGKPGNYQINIGQTTNTQKIRPIGVMAWNSQNPGITILTTGCSGKAITEAANLSSGFSAAYYYPLLQPDLIMLSLLLNSLGDATYTADLTAYATACKQSANDLVLFDGPQPAPSRANFANFATIQAASKAYATANGYAYISCTDYLGANPEATGGNYNGDNVGHLSPIGYCKYAAAIARPLVEAIAQAA